MLRIGTGLGTGERLERVLDALALRAPDTRVEAAIGASPGWAVLYAAHSRQLRTRRVAFTPVGSGEALSLPTVRAVNTTTATGFGRSSRRAGEWPEPGTISIRDRCRLRTLLVPAAVMGVN